MDSKTKRIKGTKKKRKKHDKDGIWKFLEHFVSKYLNPNLTMFKLNYFQQVDSWNFDMFTFSRAAKGSPLKYLGK